MACNDRIFFTILPYYLYRFKPQSGVLSEDAVYEINACLTVNSYTQSFILQHKQCNMFGWCINRSFCEMLSEDGNRLRRLRMANEKQCINFCYTYYPETVQALYSDVIIRSTNIERIAYTSSS